MNLLSVQWKEIFKIVKKLQQNDAFMESHFEDYPTLIKFSLAP